MPQMDDRCLFPPPYDKAYGRSVNTLISDSNILTPDLHQRALNLLSVLDQPAYSAYNRPSWIDRLTSDEPPRPSSCTFTARRMVDAMYAAVDDLGLEEGARYISAAVCASAIHEPSGADEQLALRLSRLAFTWTAYMLWPFYADLWAARSEQCGCGSDTCDSSTCPEQERHERIELDVKRRDRFKCFMTGLVDDSYESEFLYDHPESSAKYTPMQIPHILKTFVAQSTDPATRVTLNMLQHFSPFPHALLSDIDGPQNRLCLSVNPAFAFEEHLWTLKPTETSNHYRIVIYPTYGGGGGTEHITDSVTFRGSSQLDLRQDTQNQGSLNVSTSTVLDFPPPHPDLIRLRAALTDVLHRSGAQQLFAHVLGPVRARHIERLPRAWADGKHFLRFAAEVESVLEHEDTVSAEVIWDIAFQSWGAR